MANQRTPRRYTRRDFLKLGGGLVAATAGAYLVPRAVTAAAGALQANQAPAVALAATPLDQRYYHLMVTDGWIYMPPTPDGTTFHPDPWAEAPRNTYTFGFRNVTGMSDADIRGEKGKVQLSSPILYAKEGGELRITLTNLGFAARPDLTDGHTVHFHGFPNAVPAFDGVPELSIGVPYGRSYTYFYRPKDPGTYKYHCHFEDIEHVSMGMTGIVFIRPAMNDKWAYNDASTAFDREFALLLGEVWTQERWEGAHIQEHDWSDYDPDYWTINGRVHPDTLASNGDPMATTASGLPDGREELRYQPISSLITCNSGDKVLLRFSNLGFQRHAMRVDGLNLRVVGKDAKFLGAQAYDTDTVDISPGETMDVLFTAPVVASQTTYLLYNRKLAYLNNGGMPGLGGQMTEIRVSPSGVPAQDEPNT
jgi:FtsP/CotA-like multicopper oxidase with cupredoxin domain